MAQKRMFDKIITNSDDFMNMPPTSQILYFHLSMNADDDGFVNNWKSIMILSHCTENDLKILIMKAYIVPFENGVIVIRHWRLNNFLRKDRYKPTIYQDEFNQLIIKDNGEYELNADYRLTNGQPSIDKNRIDKNSINNPPISPLKEEEEEDNQKKFKKPTLEEVKTYCLERKNNIDPQQFVDFYESKGWKVGKNTMKDWKACVRTWERNHKNEIIEHDKELPTWFDNTYEKEKIETNEIDEILKDFE